MRRRRRRAICDSICDGHTSCPASSTSTCTASRDATRSMAATRSRASPRGCRASASPRSARRRLPARRTRSGRCSRPCAPRGSRRPPASPRVLPAHLESNFINPEYQRRAAARVPASAAADRRTEGEFTGEAILEEIAAARPDVGIVTIAPEIDGALDLIRIARRPRTSRVARPFRARPTSRRSRASPPARARRRTCSTA